MSRVPQPYKRHSHSAAPPSRSMAAPHPPIFVDQSHRRNPANNPTTNRPNAYRTATGGAAAGNKGVERKGTTRHERENKGKDDDKDDPRFIGPWKIGRTIGRGSSGRVKIAKHTKTGQYAAVKIVPRQLLLNSRMSINEAGAKADKMMLGIEREIVIMKLIEHPNILRLYDVWETGSELYLIMEYVEGGELFDYLVSRGRLGEDEALQYFQQLISGIDYCHRFNICHRDLKPENLLLDKDRNIKIADFGMAALERENKLLETSCGSPHYASPEIVSGTHYHGSSSDIWSCGIILFALLVGRLPFDDENIRTLLSKVKVGKFIMPRELPEMVQDLIRRMLEVDPKKRITMEGIRAHPWFTRRPPRVGPKYLEPPTPQEIERPIDRIEDIDVDILANLRVLWYNPPERVIVDALISKEKNWEKVFYFLLTKYRARNLENFNEEEDIGPRALEMETGTTSTTSRSSTQNRDGGQSKRTRISTIPEMPERPMSPPPPSQTATTAVIKPITISRPNSPHKLGRALPSPPGSPTKTGVPVIQLQEATPQKGSYVHKEREPTFVEVDPSTTPAPVIPIHIPHVEDAAMQRFFHDIVDQLQTMSVKTASVGSASPSLFGGSTTPSSMDSPMLGEGSACVGGNHSPAVGSGAGEKAVDNRFEDAEGDYSMVDVEALNAAKVKLPERPLSARPTALHRTSTRTTSSNPSRQSSGSSVIGTRGGRGVSGQAPTTSVAMQNPGSLPTKPQPVAVGQQQHVRYSIDNKENQFATGKRSTIQQEGPKGILSPTKNEKRTTLGLAIQSVEVPRFDGSEKSGGLLKKRKVPDTTNSPILSDPMSPRQSWFANLFNWKQLSYTLLSTDNISATRSECKKILTSFGVVVIVENSEGNAVLKCRVEEIVDSNSNSSVLKPVKFRVDFTSHNTVSPTLSGHPSPKLNEPKHITCLNMVMEKGAHSTFRAIYNRLKKEWELDTGRSPVITQGFQPEAMMMV